MIKRITYLPSINILTSYKAEIESLCLKILTFPSLHRSLKCGKIETICLLSFRSKTIPDCIRYINGCLLL